MTRSCCSSSNKRCPGLGSATSTLSFSRRADSPRTPSYGPQTSAWQTSPHASGSSSSQPSTEKEEGRPGAVSDPTRLADDGQKKCGLRDHLRSAPDVAAHDSLKCEGDRKSVV